MTSRTDRNPITGDKLQTKPSTQKYRDGWDAIFGKAGYSKPPKIMYELTYSNGIKRVKEFNTVEEAQWFIHNEGDHVINYDKPCCGKCSPCKGHDNESKKDEENDREIQESK